MKSENKSTHENSKSKLALLFNFKHKLKFKSILFSVIIHFLFGFILFFNSNPDLDVSEKVEVEILPTQPAKLADSKNVSEKIQEKVIKPAPAKKAVYGISSNSFISDPNLADPNAAEIKVGNTINKEFDNLKLDKNDEGMIPVDDFLVTEMPKPKNEIRIPYPENAKIKNLQGPVVMELLINSAGQVASVKLISGPGEELNQAALSAAAKLEFTPAKIKEKSVAVIIRYTYRFQLNN